MTDLPPPAPAPETAPRTDGNGRILRIALILSLAANLLIVGIVAGAIAGRDRDRDGRPDRALADVGFNPFIAALPPSDRRAMGIALVKRAGDLRRNRTELRREFGELLTALRADPYDGAAVRDSVTGQQARLAERQEIGRELLFERLDAMTVEERRSFADALEDRMRRGPRWRDRDDE